MQNVVYNEHIVTQVRQWAKHADRHTVAVLTGALVSPDYFAHINLRKGINDDGQRPYCGAGRADFERVVWSCGSFPRHRPPRPQCPTVPDGKTIRLSTL